VDDDEGVAESLRILIEQEGGSARILTHPRGLEAEILRYKPELILCDLRLPERSGKELLLETRRLHPEIPFALMSAYGTLDTAQELLEVGAIEYLIKPIRREKIRELLERLRAPGVEAIFSRKAPQNARFGPLVGNHPLMRNLFALIEKVAPYGSTVLITGESGSGKELVARVIHQKSPRKEGPFVAVNCGAIPATLLESELFGYQKGAFTGADRDRTGLIEEARGGTLFLDEIAELPLDLQVKLLRVLEEGKVLPLGASRPRPVDVRWVSATHKDLEALVRSGRFRLDLYYRLKVIEIRIPPLRQRAEDIPLIAGEWLYTLNERYGKEIEGIEPSAVPLLIQYPWPGNVRELQNILERAYILTEGKWITREALSALLSGEIAEARSDRVPEDLDLPRAIQELEVRYITEALRRTRGNRTRAAKLLKISHRALLYKIKEYQIDPEGGSHPGSETASSPRSEPHNAEGSPD
jgi:two-component system response regulator AtoC